MEAACFQDHLDQDLCEVPGCSYSLVSQHVTGAWLLPSSFPVNAFGIYTQASARLTDSV